MAQVEESENSAGEYGGPKSQSSARSHATTKNVVEESEHSDDDNAKEGSDEGDSEEGEEEYEIEAILDAKRGMFKKGEQAFLVKWKGYGPDENSWVSEADAGNAQDLINEFLAARAKAKEQSQRPSARGRKPNSAKLSKDAKAATPDTESVSVSTTKRGRGRAPSSSSSEDKPHKTKKSRTKTSANGSASAKRGTLASLDRTDDEDVTMADSNRVVEKARAFTTMKDLKMGSLKSWEDYVKTVSTVERHDNVLMVYFETTDGKYVREPSTICAKKFPQKLIQFYEGHLRWKSTDEDDVDTV